LTRGISP